MAPILFHGVNQLGLPVVCVESRQAYQALKSLATHKTDRNDARGLAHLARTGFFKPVHVKSLQAHALRSLISARKKLVGQRVTLENQIRGLTIVFGIRLPRALTAAFIDQALKASEGIAGLSAAMRGLIAARTAVMTAVAAIDADMRDMTRASAACRRLMTIPGVGQLTALAFVAAIDDPSRIRRSRDIGAYLGLVPRRHQSGEVDYTGGISKCGDRRVRTLLYEAANVMLTRYKGQLKLKDWAFAIARRSTMRKARVALARRLAIIMHAMLRDGTEFEFVKPASHETGGQSSSQAERRPREGADDGVDCVAGASRWPTAISTEPRCTQLTPSSAERAQRTQAPESVDTRRASALTHYENAIRANETWRTWPVSTSGELADRDGRRGRLIVAADATLSVELDALTSEPATLRRAGTLSNPPESSGTLQP